MIRKAQSSDIPRIAEIHVFGWRHAYRGIISDDVLFTKRIVAKSISRFSDAIEKQAEETYVFDDGIIKAFMTVGNCRDGDKPQSFELWGIYVEPLMKRQGIGSKLIEFCEAQAKERGFKEIYIWVLEKNLSARSFYEKHGYKTDGTKKFLEIFNATEMRYSKNL